MNSLNIDLPISKIDRLKMYFAFPLLVDVTDWSYFDKTTGCLE